MNGNHSEVNSEIEILNKKYIASGSDDMTINIWKYESAECIFTLIGHTKPVSILVYIPSKKLIVSGSIEKSIKNGIIKLVNVTLLWKDILVLHSQWK